MDTMKLTLVTPEAAFLTLDATLVEAPGTLGDFGAMPGHMPFVSTLRPGAVRVHTGKDKPLVVFVSGGIAEIDAQSCTILAERAVDPAKTSRGEMEAQLAHAHERLSDAPDSDLAHAAARDVALAEAVLAALV